MTLLLMVQVTHWQALNAMHKSSPAVPAGNVSRERLGCTQIPPSMFVTTIPSQNCSWVCSPDLLPADFHQLWSKPFT